MTITTALTIQGVLAALYGKRLTFFCENYIYTGALKEAAVDYVCLTQAAIVYETGDLKTKDWQDAQALPHDQYIMLSAVESFGILK